jgi:hypothetical protein
MLLDRDARKAFPVKVLKTSMVPPEIFSFIKDYKVVRAENKYINISIDSEFVARLSEKTGLPLRNYYLSETQIRSILNCKL